MGKMIEFLFGVATSLTASAIDRKISRVLTFSEKRKVEAKISEISIAVIEPLTEFLKKEHVPDGQVCVLVEIAKNNVEWIIQNPNFSFDRGLDGEKITRDLISLRGEQGPDSTVKEFPAAFETINRAFVDLVTKTPEVFDAWERTSFQTIFTKIEDLKGTLSAIYDAIQKTPTFLNDGDESFYKIVSLRTTTLALKTSIHGLRQSAIPQAELDNLFVFPQIQMESIKSTLEYEAESDELSIDDFVNNDWSDNADQSENLIDNFEEFSRTLIQQKNLILQGPAGSGKTTLSNWISAQFLKQSPGYFPIIVPLRKVTKKDALPNLTDLFSEHASPAFSDTITAEKVRKWGSDGKLIVIFEGFDEVGENSRLDVLNWIEGIKVAHENVPTLITTRPLSTSHIEQFLGLGWKRSSLIPFNKQRVELYISQFQKHGPEIQTSTKLQKAESLANAWRADPTLRPLTGNPLLLSTLLVVHHMDGELPDDRSTLYERYIDGMLGLWETIKDLSAPSVRLTKEQKKKVLEIIAINMIHLEVDAASEEDVAKWIASYLEQESISCNSEDVLAHLRERSGLLIGPGQYTFAHKSIGEFLVARACNDGVQVNFYGVRFDRFLLSKNCTKDRWVTVAFLWSGIAPKAEVQEFISSIINQDERPLGIGLILERKRALSPEWFKKIFWNCVKTTTSPAPHSNSSRSFYVTHSIFNVLTTDPDQHELSEITSITGAFAHEADLFHSSFKSHLIKPDDWVHHDIKFSGQAWLPLLRHASLTPELLLARPDSISVGAGKYMFVREAIRRSLQGRLSLGDVDWIDNFEEKSFSKNDFITAYLVEEFVNYKAAVLRCEKKSYIYELEQNSRYVSELLRDDHVDLIGISASEDPSCALLDAICDFVNIRNSSFSLRDDDVYGMGIGANVSILNLLKKLFPLPSNIDRIDALNELIERLINLAYTHNTR